MLHRKQVLFLQAWGNVRNGGNPSKNLADVQREYIARSQEDANKARLVEEARKKAMYNRKKGK